MNGLGALRVVVAVFGTVVGWIFVGHFAAASDHSLEVTVQTLDAVDDTIDLAESVSGGIAHRSGSPANFLSKR